MSAWTHEFRFSLPAPPERVFEALSAPAELERWFAERVEVEPRAGGAFRFWGRHSYGTPDRERAAQRLTRWEPPRALAFCWTIDGVESTVALELAPDDEEAHRGGTRLVLHHAFAGPLDAPRPKSLIDDLWRLHLGNLHAHLGGGGVVRPDFDDPAPAVRLSVLIDAPRERVFRALLDPATLDRWVASAAEVEPRVGGVYRYGWSYPIDGRQVEGGPRRILELVENEKLVTDWPEWRGDETVPAQRVTWLLTDEAGKTRVTLVHDGFVRAADLGDYGFGWPEFLAALREEVERPAA